MNGAVRSQPPQIVLAAGNHRGSSIVASTAQAVRAAINTAAVAASLVLPIGGLRRDHNAEMLKGGGGSNGRGSRCLKPLDAAADCKARSNSKVRRATARLRRLASYSVKLPHR